MGNMFCIPPHLVEDLKNSEQLRTDTNVAKLKDMSSKELESFFVEHTNPELGKFITTKFEKAAISADQSALTDWAKSIFKPSTQLEKDSARLEQLRKVEKPSDMQKLQMK